MGCGKDGAFPGRELYAFGCKEVSRYSRGRIAAMDGLHSTDRLALWIKVRQVSHRSIDALVQPLYRGMSSRTLIYV